MMTDPIADALTRVRNAVRAGHEEVVVPYSRFRESVLKRLVDSGFLKSIRPVVDGSKKTLIVTLRYTADKQPILTGISRVSKPGHRIYRGYKDLQPVMSGLGLLLLSTPRGVMTDREAREKKAGGEVICKVW